MPREIHGGKLLAMFPTLLALLACALLQVGAARWERFPVFVWPQGAGASEIVRAFGGACVQRADDARELRAQGLDYFVFNAPGRNDLHLERDARHQRRWQRWYDERDDADLLREPCLADPATRARLDGLLDASLRARDGQQGFGVSLGDEIGLTPGGAPEDVCLCARCQAAWEPFAAARGVTLGLAAISTDATRARLADGDTRALGPWLLRRSFHQAQVLDVVAALARRSRAASPHTPVGLLGLAGQSAFGGVAVERVLPELDFIECYRVGNARELAFTLRAPEQRVLATVFVDERGPAFTAWQAWEHWLRGGDGCVVWSEAELARQPAQRARLLQALGEIRGLQARIGRFLPRPQGVAVVHAPLAVAASWLRDARQDGQTWPKRFQSYQETHGALETSRRRWFELLEDLGAMPGALPLASVDSVTAARFGLLVLDHLLVLDDADMARLERFVAAGGRLCVVGELGWIDASGRARGAERAKQLGELGAKSFVTAPDALDTYAGEPARAAALGAWLAPGDAAHAPFTVSDPERRFCWISTWMAAGDGFVCAALPKPRASVVGKRADLLPAQVEIAAPQRWRVEWLHPAPGSAGVVVLPPGDAAVFRLVPKS